MRTWIICLGFMLLIVSCDKVRIAKQIEGRWLYEKQMNVDGTYTPQNKIFEFTECKAALKSAMPFFIYGQDTMQQLFRVIKGNRLEITDSLGKIENWLVEDLYHKSMVVRTNEGVMFFKKL